MNNQEHEKEIGYCNKCGFKFSYELIHNGFKRLRMLTVIVVENTLLEEHYKQIPKHVFVF